VRDRRSEAQTDYPEEGGPPRHRYPPPPRPGARAARAARAARQRPTSGAQEESEVSGRPSALDEGAQGESPSLPAMVGIVGLSVAVIILVSFAAGYGFGRLFL
jgi:hypothetical protein